MNNLRIAPVVPIVTGVSLILLLIAPWLGAVDITLENLLDKDPSSTTIFFQLRIPQVLLAFFIGASLGVAGLVYQALFRNPLATPYTLGVASGASLGSVLTLYLGLSGSFLFVPFSRFGGFFGATISVLLLFICAGVYVRKSIAPLLLIGVALGFLCSSIILLLQYISSPTQGYIALRWLMGGLETVGYQEVAELATVFVLVCAFLSTKSDELDLLSIDEDIAAARGVNVYRNQLFLLLISSMLVGVAVSIAGPIGFIGLVVPHACRMCLGPRHRILLPVVICSAGSFLVICDCLSRVVLAPMVLPVGVITSLLGAPFFLYLLIRDPRDF